MSEPLSGGYDPACIADWDAVSYSMSTPPCLRRVDLDVTVDDRTGSPHQDGRIWSRALYDIRLALGGQVADTIVIDSHTSFTEAMAWADAARHVVARAEALFGSTAADVARAAFEDRGIL